MLTCLTILTEVRSPSPALARHVSEKQAKVLQPP
jgi:hypothetical protein